MEPPVFALERWFDKYEHSTELHLGEGHLRGLSASRFDLNAKSLDYVVPTDGDPKLRAEVGERYGKQKEQVLFTCGAQEANLLASLTVLEEEDHAVTVLPTYKALSNVPDAFAQTTKVKLELPEWELPIEEIKQSIKPSTSLIVIDNPNNPTGKYHSLNKIKELYDIAESNDIFLLCDEGNRKLISDTYPPVASFGDYGISTSSVTKPYGLPGIRFGWVIANENVINTASKWKKHTTISLPMIGQYIAKQALGEQEERILSMNRELVNKNHNIISGFVDKYGLEWYDSDTATGFVTVPQGFDDSRDFCEAAVQKQDVLLVPGDVFGFDNRFRIGFGISTETVTEGISRIESII